MTYIVSSGALNSTHSLFAGDIDVGRFKTIHFSTVARSQKPHAIREFQVATKLQILELVHGIPLGGPTPENDRAF